MNTQDIPQDIIDLFFMFYHNMAYFSRAGKLCSITENGTMVSKYTSGMRNSCFGSLKMPSQNEKDIIYEYKIKVIKSGTVCIGICNIDVIEECINADFAGDNRAENYSWCTNGYLYSHAFDFWEKDQGTLYEDGDTITMTYNPFKAKLKWYKNDAESPTMKVDDVDAKDDIVYCLAVFMGDADPAVVQLVF